MAPDRHALLRGPTNQGGRVLSGGGSFSNARVIIQGAAFVRNAVGFEGGAMGLSARFSASIPDDRLVLRRVRFEDSASTRAGDAHGGVVPAWGSVFARSFVSIEDRECVAHVGESSGGAIRFHGAADNQGGGVVLHRSRFTDNRSGGAAILATASSFNVSTPDRCFGGSVAPEPGHRPMRPGEAAARRTRPGCARTRAR